ncbi:organic cation transporter protein [Patella vulgata]|uniref:organic cation transporter protein n=1 Tax=Patella vulgata TaxID=6465 RepID=UPI0024A97A26|nr:organic cation transporter protein [Patella vulgata]
MKFDDVLETIGPFGKYQKIRCFLLCLFSFVSAWHAFNMVFIGAEPKFHCDNENINISSSNKSNVSDDVLLELLVPDDPCKQYDEKDIVMLYDNYTGNHVLLSNISTTDCTRGFWYSKEKYSSTIVSQFDLVCKKKFWTSTSKSVFFLGRLCGAVSFGQLSDRFGRRPMFFVGAAILLVAGSIAAAAQNIYMFLPMYFLQGLAHTGIFLVAFTLSTELVGPEYRFLVSVTIQMFYSVGCMILSGMAYLLRDWRYLELAITLPVVLFATYWWFLPESVRWLLSHNRYDEAHKYLQEAAATNGTTLSPSIMKSLQDDNNNDGKTIQNGRKYYFLDLVRTWPMAKISLNIWFNWFANALVYYGLSLNTENLVGDPYLNFCIAGAVEIPAYILCIVFLNKVGRKLIVVISMCVGGIACILSGTVYINVTIVLAMIGKFFITASYGMLYLLAAEVFPTVVRNIGVGVSSMSGSIGGILVPSLLDLNTIWTPLPLVIFGSLSITAGTLALLLPETTDKPMPQLLEDLSSSE